MQQKGLGFQGWSRGRLVRVSGSYTFAPSGGLLRCVGSVGLGYYLLKNPP